MAKAKKTAKKQVKEQPLKIYGSFEEVIGVSLGKVRKYAIVESDGNKTPIVFREFSSTPEQAPFEFAYQMLGNSHLKTDKGYYLKKDYPNKENLHNFYPLSFGSIMIGKKVYGYSEIG